MITKKTKLFIKTKFLAGNNYASGKFYYEQNNCLWECTKEVFDLYKGESEQSSVYRGYITSVNIFLLFVKNPVISLEYL